MPRFDKEGADSPFADLGCEVEDSPSRGQPTLPVAVDKEAVGKPVAEFVPSGQGLLILIGLGVLLVGVLLVSAALTTRTIRLVPAVGCVALFFGGCLIFFGVIRLGRRVVVCEKGFADCWMLSSRGYRWTDVRSIHQAIFRIFNGPTYSHTAYTFNVRMEDGTKLEYENDAFDEIALLGRHIQNGVARARFPLATADLDAGKWVDFDELRISKGGIERGGEVLPWSEMEEIHAAKGELVVVRRSGKETWNPIDVKSIPNLALLSSLIDHALGAGA